jgi:sulfur carrier protein
MTVTVTVNGHKRELPAGSTVARLVETMPGAPEGRGVAVALEGEVVPRNSWPSTELHEGASIEVVVAVQGG